MYYSVLQFITQINNNTVHYSSNVLQGGENVLGLDLNLYVWVRLTAPKLHQSVTYITVLNSRGVIHCVIVKIYPYNMSKRKAIIELY